MSVPMIPVSPNLGGGMMPCFKRQPKPGACTSPWCQAKAAAHVCELLTTEERARVVATWQARHKGQCAVDENWALKNLACDLNQAQREKCQKERICEMEDAIAMLAQEWRGRSAIVARLDALTSAWAKRRVALDGGGES